MAEGDLNHLLSKSDQTEVKKDSWLVMLKPSPEVNAGERHDWICLLSRLI